MNSFSGLIEIFFLFETIHSIDIHVAKQKTFELAVHKINGMSDMSF